MPEGPFHDRTALVTGASRGIGAATAKALAAQGVRLLLVARSERDLEQVASEIRKNGGEAHVFPCDLSDEQAVYDMAKAVQEKGWTPDILVNNAGAGMWKTVEETETGEAKKMIELPYLAAFHVTRAFLPEMKKLPRANIVIVNSFGAFAPWPGATGYTASRWALRGFALALQSELRHSRLLVSHCVFSQIESNYFRSNPGSWERLPRVAFLMKTITTDSAAQHILRAIRKGKREMFRPRPLPFFGWLSRVFPGIVRRLMNKTGWKPK